MRTLTLQEKRTIRLGSTGLGLYLALFLGLQGWKLLERQRESYQNLLSQSMALKLQLGLDGDRVEVAQKLMNTYQIDPAQLSRQTVVGNASVALQRAASAGGVLLGPIRESSSRTTTKELASLQIEGSGGVGAVLGWLKRLETLGYPLIIDTLQISSDPTKPDQVKFSLTMVILDFEQWKNEDKPHA